MLNVVLSAALLVAFLASPMTAQAIVGGTDAPSDETPWMVALIDTSATPPGSCVASGGSTTFCQHVCGGVLVSPTWILTAAHCLIGRDREALRVIIGAQDLNVGGLTLVKPSGIHTAPGAPILQQPVYENDLALLHLPEAQPATPASIIDPVTLQAIEFAPDAFDDEATVLGWGRLSNEGAFPPFLNSVALDLTVYTCESTYPLFFDLNIMTCAAEPMAAMIEPDDAGDPTPRDPDGEDSCTLDSGGPLLVEPSADAGRWLAGIVSWGQNAACGDATLPGVYTRVPAFLEWIEATTAAEGDALGDIAIEVDAGKYAAANTNEAIRLRLSNYSLAREMTGTGFTVTYSGGTLTLAGAYGLTCTAGTGTYQCDAGTLPAYAAVEAHFTGRGTADSTLVIDVVATDDGSSGDYRSANDTAHHELSFTAKPDVFASIRSAVTEVDGDAGNAWLFLEFGNRSTWAAADDATLTITLPPGHTLTDDDGLGCSGTSELTCLLGTLPPGEKRKATISLASAPHSDGEAGVAITSSDGDFPVLRGGTPDSADSAAVAYVDPADTENPPIAPPRSVNGSGGAPGIMMLAMLLLLSGRRSR